MGCGQSKSDPETKARTSKLMPLLLRPRNEDSSVSLSKKELLKHGVHHHHEDDQSLSHSHSVEEIENDKKSMASREGSVRPPAKVAEKKENKADHKLEEKKEEKDDKLEENKDQEKETDQEEKKGENEEESEDEGRFSNCYLCPEGSPSFRVYCVDQSLENVMDVDSESKKDVNDESDQNSQGVDSETAASVDSKEDSGKTKEKGKKEKGFSIVMSKGKKGAVKHLFNVNSCYHRRHHHDTALLAQN